MRKENVILKTTPQQMVSRVSRYSIEYVCGVWKKRKKSKRVEDITEFIEKGLTELEEEANHKFNDKL